MMRISLMMTVREIILKKFKAWVKYMRPVRPSNWICDDTYKWLWTHLYGKYIAKPYRVVHVSSISGIMYDFSKGWSINSNQGNKFSFYTGINLLMRIMSLNSISWFQDELRSMNQVYEQGIELLGFKSIESIKPYYHIKPANFLYPDEKSVQGEFLIIFKFFPFIYLFI